MRRLAVDGDENMLANPKCSENGENTLYVHVKVKSIRNISQRQQKRRLIKPVAKYLSNY